MHPISRRQSTKRSFITVKVCLCLPVVDCQRSTNSRIQRTVQDLEDEIRLLETEAARLGENSMYSDASPAHEPAPSTAYSDHDRLALAVRESSPSSIDLTVLREVETVTLYRGETYSLYQMLRRALQLDNSDPRGLLVRPAHQPLEMRRTQVQSSTCEVRTITGLPEHHCTIAYVDNYFSCLHPTFPFLIEADVRSTLKASYSDQEHSPARTVILYLVMAIGSVFPCSHSFFDIYNSTSFFLRAVEVSFPYEESIETVQILVLFTIYSLFDSSMGRTWDLIDLAMQTCLVIGLHQPLSIQTRNNLRPGRADGGAQIFWTAFVLDL